MPMDVKGKRKPTLKMQHALMDYVLHPTDTYKDIAERNGVQAVALSRAIDRNREWVNEKSLEVWQKKKTMAMRMAEHLAERGNWKAIEFILRANDINPEQRITNSEQEIHITIDEEKPE